MFLCREKFWKKFEFWEKIWKKFGKKFGKILTKSFLEKFWRALSNCFLSLLYSYNMLPSHAETFLNLIACHIHHPSQLWNEKIDND